jgi:hypothetical protein
MPPWESAHDLRWDDREQTICPSEATVARSVDNGADVGVRKKNNFSANFKLHLERKSELNARRAGLTSR